MERNNTADAVLALQNASLSNLEPLSESSQGEAIKAEEAKSLNADPISAILKEVGTAQKAPKRYGVLRARPMNAWIEDSLSKPDPRTFFHDLFVEGENTVVFATSNVGKTVYVMQAAAEIARYEKLCYIDFEMSDKQVEMRYVDKETGAIHQFPENLIRAELSPEDIDNDDIEQCILDSVKEAAKQGIKFFVIDNLSFVCNDGEKSSTAGSFMRKLIKLKKEFSLTTIVVAHTPKRRIAEPITQNDLAGSAKLMALFDAGIAISRSAADDEIRYVKQVKVRTGELRYGQDNVILYDVVKIDGFLKFEFRGYGKEDDHLKGREGSDDTDDILSLLRLQKEGKSFREMAKAMDLSLGKVQRLLKKAKDENITLEQYEGTGVSECINVSETENTIHPIQADTVRLPFKDED